MTRVEITVRAMVSPTESVEKVERSIRNLLGDVDLSSENRGGNQFIVGRLEGIESLGYLKAQIRKERVREAARSLFTRIADNDRLSFGLNKQAAFVGRLSFYGSGEAPLGPIQITIVGDVDSVIDSLCGYR
jgi:predicted RNA binding protein with dsRBD fold (UPF0201 family)